MTETTRSWSMEKLQSILQQYWGFTQLRPLQERAITTAMERRDSLVVMPTGGGKSLCYQAPAMLREDLTVVVSPLISLMKDQVDGLRASGINAAQIDSSQSAGERLAYERSILRKELRLLFVSPERLVGGDFFRLLQQAGVGAF